MIVPHVGNGEGYRNQFGICKKNANRPHSHTAVCGCVCVCCVILSFLEVICEN